MIALSVVVLLLALLGLVQVVVVFVKLPGMVRDEVRRRQNTLEAARALADWKARQGA